MNRTELVDAVGERLGDRRTAALAVEAVLDTVTATLSDGQKVALFGFGVFERVDRAARTARNPATGGTVEVPATAVPRFRPGQALKDAVNGRTSGATQRTRPSSRTADASAGGTEVAGTKAVSAKAAASTKKAESTKKADSPKKADIKKLDGKKADGKKKTDSTKKADAKKKKADSKKAGRT